MRRITSITISAKHRVLWFLRFALEQYRGLFIVAETVMFSIGVAFWIEASLSGQAFSVETWGRVCLMFKAEFWAGLMMIQSALMLNGLINPVNRKRVAIGAGIAAWHFGVVAYSALFTGGEFVVGVYAALFFVPLHMLILASAVHRDRS